MPPWPNSVSEPMMPGAGTDQDRVPAEGAGRGVEGADRADRLVLAAVGGAGGDVAGEQAALAELGDVAGQRPRQRAARRLHVADPDPRPRLRRRPGRRRQVAVQRQAPRPAGCGPRTRSSSGGFSAQLDIARAASTGSTGCWSEV